MKNFKIKLFHIFPVLQLSLFSCITLLALLEYTTLQYHTMPIPAEWLEIWIPIILPWIPILFWLRFKLRILEFKDSDRGRFVFQMIAWIIMVGPLIFSQKYINAKTGKFEEVATAENVLQDEDGRFYKIKEYEIVKSKTTASVNVTVSGKHSEHLNFDYYFLAPLVSGDTEAINLGDKVCWFEKKYHESISNRGTDEEKEDKYKKFYKQYNEEFLNTGFKDVLYFEKVGPSEALDFGLKAIHYSINKPVSNAVILIPHYESLGSLAQHSLKWFLILWLGGSTLYMFALIFPRISLTNLNKIKKGEKLPKGDLEEMLQFLIPKGDHFMTSILLLLIIAAFLYSAFSGVNLISPSSADLMAVGANRRLETTGGEYWRLITSVFLHGGVMHLFLNITGLCVISGFLEPAVGRFKYLLIYFFSGLTGSIASIFWHDSTASVGASGAIFGLNGAFLALILFGKMNKEEKTGLFMFVGGYTLLNLILGMFGNIDNAAHIGGLMGGFVLACLLLNEVPKIFKVLIAILFTAATGYATHNLFVVFPQGQKLYQEKMQRFEASEAIALKMSENLGNYQTLEIEQRKQQTLKEWTNCITYVKETETLDLIDYQKRRNKFLLEYSETRFKEAEMLYKVYLVNEDRYSDSLKYYNNEINSIMEKYR